MERERKKIEEERKLTEIIVEGKGKRNTEKIKTKRENYEEGKERK